MGTEKNRLNEHPKNMFKLMGKKLQYYDQKVSISWTYGVNNNEAYQTAVVQATMMVLTHGHSLEPL